MQNNLVPVVNKNYVPFDESYGGIKMVIQSNKFYPVRIVGPTGCGKTMTTTQVCAETKREMVRVNLTSESDEDSLMGGFRLVNNDMVFNKGPVLVALERGAVLLLDELDLADPERIMCLQAILDGDGYFIKRTGEMVMPKEGFNIIATSNTKGSGDDNGLYIGTKISNEANLDRFPVMFLVDYPPIEEERKILNNVQKGVVKNKVSDEDIDLLLRFANKVRDVAKKSEDDTMFQAISTRRLCDMVEAMHLFGTFDKGFQMCINRFSDVQITAFKTYIDLLRGDRPEAKVVPEDSSFANYVPF